MWVAHPKPTQILVLITTIIIQSLAFPMLSSSIFSSNGSIYQQSAVFGPQFQLNQTALNIVGLPILTGSNAWANLTSNLAVSLIRKPLRLGSIMLATAQIGGLIAHVVLFWGPYARDCFKLAHRREQPDPHYQVSMALFWERHNNSNVHAIIKAMQKYKEAPLWWYIVLLSLSFFAGKPSKSFMSKIFWNHS